MVKSPTTPTAALIVEGDSSQVLFYGPDKTRWLQVDSVNGQVAAKTYYFDDFELRVAGNVVDRPLLW